MSFRKILFLCLLCVGVSCTKKEPEKTPTAPTILVTIAPYATITEAIAGQTVTIETLIPSTANIHVYEPTPKQVESSIKAKVWFRIDELFEVKMLRFIEEQNPEQKIVNLQEGLNLLPSHDAVSLTPCTHAHYHGAYDLHTWLNPIFVKQQAKTIHDTLVELFPEHEKLYTKNLIKLIQKLTDLNETIAELLAPYQGEAILSSHPAFAYFCKEYDLLQLSVECEGKEPRPKDVEEIFKKAQNYHPRVALLQLGFNNRGAELIAKKLGIPIYTFNPFSRDYFTNMKQLAEHIAQ
ncbi:MAG: High-affinity zinc uptake system binding-protein ZnuA [Chlamydiae bacterium]|nr:High-affinity zinc uptake system binding-protein ZnuA [Chlamydiota bacterium]